MAINKNQHYVPRCYLKEFTNNSEGRAINLYNIDRKKIIPSAPVKNQCSKNYFYGKNKNLEDAIQSLEQSYAHALTQLKTLPNNLNNQLKSILRQFWLFQHLRTEAAATRFQNHVDTITNELKIDMISDRLAVLLGMRAYFNRRDVIDDLKICLVLNKTNLPFVTSDDPAVLSNKWHLTSSRTFGSSFGLGSSGSMIFLPLSPHLMCIGYDGDVYTVAHEKGYICTYLENDIISFNQHQFLNCMNNIYLKEKAHSSFVDTSFNEISKNRISNRHMINYAVLDHNDGELSHYKVIDPKLRKKQEPFIINSQKLNPRPTSWPSVLKIRTNGSVYTNGSAMGFIRKHHIPSGSNDFQKEKTR